MGVQKHVLMPHREGTRNFTHVVLFTPRTTGARDTVPCMWACLTGTCLLQSELGQELRYVWLQSLSALIILPLIGH